jgi:hypothetical protein
MELMMMVRMGWRRRRHVTTRTSPVLQRLPDEHCRFTNIEDYRTPVISWTALVGADDSGDPPRPFVCVDIESTQ